MTNGERQTAVTGRWLASNGARSTKPYERVESLVKSRTRRRHRAGKARERKKNILSISEDFLKVVMTAAKT